MDSERQVERRREDQRIIALQLGVKANGKRIDDIETKLGAIESKLVKLYGIGLGLLSVLNIIG